MRNKKLAPNVDNSNLGVYPNGRIKDNTGGGNGTPVNEFIYGDLHEMKDKLMRLYGIAYNDLPDNETNGFQLVEALRALASKNDFITALSTDGTILNVGVKLSFMLEKEFVLCNPSFDLTSETQIKGIDNTTFNIVKIGDFKANEYVRLIKTAAGVTLIREVDAVNLDLSVGEFNYLKKATQIEEDAGTIETKATTPKSNKSAFTKRVNGSDSASYLATISQNGLLSKEDKAILDNIGSSPVKNQGWFSGVDVGNMTVSDSLAVSGDISVATILFNTAGLTVIRCTMSNAMTNTNYRVGIDCESQGSFDNDSRTLYPSFKPISTTQFDIGIRESSGSTSNLKLHVQVTQI